MTELLGFTDGFHAEMVPSSVANMKKAGAVLPFCEMLNPCVLLKTWPVGVPVPVAPGGAGAIAT